MKRMNENGNNDNEQAAGQSPSTSLAGTTLQFTPPVELEITDPTV